MHAALVSEAVARAARGGLLKGRQQVKRAQKVGAALTFPDDEGFEEKVYIRLPSGFAFDEAKT